MTCQKQVRLSGPLRQIFFRQQRLSAPKNVHPCLYTSLSFEMYSINYFQTKKGTATFSCTLQNSHDLIIYCTLRTPGGNCKSLFKRAAEKFPLINCLIKNRVWVYVIFRLLRGCFVFRLAASHFIKPLMHPTDLPTSSEMPVKDIIW